jgi:hypothetical protein
MEVSAFLNTLNDLRRSCLGDSMEVSAFLNKLNDLRRSCMEDWMEVSAFLNTLNEVPVFMGICQFVFLNECMCP